MELVGSNIWSVEPHSDLELYNYIIIILPSLYLSATSLQYIGAQITDNQTIRASHNNVLIIGDGIFHGSNRDH